MKNKEIILDTARKLFSEKGFLNVRMQHISDLTGISTGNIAYHFSNINSILEAIFVEYEQALKHILIEHRNTPIFINIDAIFHTVEENQKRFSFFSTDLLEIKRTQADLFEAIFRFYQWQKFLFEDIIRFNIARGAWRSLDDTFISSLAAIIVDNLNGWPSFTRLWGDTENIPQDLPSYMWLTIKPWLSEQGQNELEVILNQKIKLNGDLEDF
jgi:AcrR family transcriptional regulator